MRIWHVPIEPLEERYSSQWIDWFAKHQEGVEQDWILPERRLSRTIETGAFLDVHDTSAWKAQQVEMIARRLKNGIIEDGDVLFFHDLWFPGIEALAYIRDGAKQRFKIAGCLHAGLWDREDFLYRQGMMKWGLYFERAMLEIVDHVFVATDFHKQLIRTTHELHIAEQQISVTGFPIYPDDFVVSGHLRNSQLVIFPHRLDAEKGVNEFNVLAEVMAGNGIQFVCTAAVCNTKQEYYNLLSKASVAVSCAYQETWGIAMQEALFSGCIPIVPDRLSYVELYPHLFRYKDADEMASLVILALASPDTFTHAATAIVWNLQQSGKQAIARMTSIMRSL